MGGVAAPFKVQGSNAVIQSKQDNQAPHPTISHFETDCINSTTTSFTENESSLDLDVSHIHRHP